jgi:aminoglycoside phosphotransferase (APT) family kinase protein
MEYNECLGLTHGVQKHLWPKKLYVLCDNGQLVDWVSTFHHHRLRCHAPKFINGGYNLGLKFVFEDRYTWLLRFVQKGSLCDTLADEKVAMEVETLSLISANTDIPVPAVRAWGLAADNPLGLGSFIIMDFIEGVSLESILKESPD